MKPIGIMRSPAMKPADFVDLSDVPTVTTAPTFVGGDDEGIKPSCPAIAEMCVRTYQSSAPTAAPSAVPRTGFHASHVAGKDPVDESGSTSAPTNAPAKTMNAALAAASAFERVAATWGVIV
jgi:hypothetical protein